MGAGALLVLVVLVGAGGFFYVQYRFHQLHRETVAGLTPITAPAGHQAPFNVLLVGDNCRNCLNGLQSNVFGSASVVGGGRSDVTMLLHVDPNTNRVSILSIPRDLWLPIPNTGGEIRVDAALNNGPGALVSTIEDALNIPINHYVELNFDTFQNVVNALGGINMYFPMRAYDAYSTLNVPAGCFHLNGYQALQVVRARHYYYQQNGVWQYDGLGDISRIQRDHEFLKVLATAVSSRGLGNPIVDNNLVGAVAKDLTIDNTFSLTDLINLAGTLSHVNLGSAPQTTMPVDEDNSPNGFVYDGAQYGAVVFPSNVGDRAAIQAFLGGPLAGGSLSPATVPVSVVNGSGMSGQAGQVATELRALGFPIKAISTGSVNSNPAETVVYYGPGHEPAAQRLANELGGAVALGQDAAIAGNGLSLLTGSNLTVASPPAPVTATPASGPTPATGATHSAPAGPTPPPAAVIGGITATSPTYPPFDPTACPPGAVARALPRMPVPPSSQLP